MFCVVRKEFARYRPNCDITFLKSFYRLEEAIRYLVHCHITFNLKKSKKDGELCYWDNSISSKKLQELQEFLVKEYKIGRAHV